MADKGMDRAQGLFEGTLDQSQSQTLSVRDNTGTDPYASKAFESKIYAPEYLVLPGAKEDGNVPSHSDSGQNVQNELYAQSGIISKNGRSAKI